MYASRWKSFVILLVCLMGIWFALPNFFSREMLERLPSWIPKTQLNLGLDLQGGSHILLEADLENVVSDYLADLLDVTRQALRKEKIGYLHLHSDLPHHALGFGLRNPLEDQERKNLFKSLQEIDSDLVVQIDERHVSLILSEGAIEKRKKSALNQSIEIVRRRIDETGTKEPTIQQQGENRILIQLPGLENPDHVKVLLGQTAKLSFRFLDEEASVEEALAGRVPPGSEVLESEENKGEQILYYVVRKPIILSGETLIDAQPSFDDKGRANVTFRFDAIGAKKFADATRANVGKRFAIILDKKVISAPVISEPITGGHGSITGNFSVQEASDFALLLRAGALPAPLTVLEERTVGPDLGADSISAGENATLFSIVLIAVFMIVAYALVGFVADIAMVFNLILLIAAMSQMGATLTLPGIAGIALTLGIAVDANVLINERIKEELRNGKRLLIAIECGYDRAMSTIIDANLTTLIGSLLLYVFGTGPIRGFAVTLTVGVLISMFTAVSLSRLILVAWVHKYRPKTLWI